MRFAVVFLSVITAALAQLTINTPVGAISCLNQQITWTGGTPPYTIQVQPGGDTSQAAIETFTGLTASPYSWHVIEAANTPVFLRLRDNTGATAESGTFTIQAGGGTCTAGSPPPAGSSSSSSSGAAVPPPASSSSSSASTPVAPPPGGSTTTPTTPAPGTVTTPGSGSSSTTHTTTSSSASGAMKMGVAGGVMGVVAAGVVALLA